MKQKEIVAEMRELLDKKEKHAYGEAEYWTHDEDRLYELTAELLKTFPEKEPR
jgi:hypothetical protein